MTPAARVQGFEPIPDIFAGLRARIAGKQGVEVFQYALEDEPATVPFSVHYHEDSSSILNPEEDNAQHYSDKSM